MNYKDKWLELEEVSERIDVYCNFKPIRKISGWNWWREYWMEWWFTSLLCILMGGTGLSIMGEDGFDIQKNDFFVVGIVSMFVFIGIIVLTYSFFGVKKHLKEQEKLNDLSIYFFKKELSEICEGVEIKDMNEKVKQFQKTLASKNEFLLNELSNTEALNVGLKLLSEKEVKWTHLNNNVDKVMAVCEKEIDAKKENTLNKGYDLIRKIKKNSGEVTIN